MPIQYLEQKNAGGDFANSLGQGLQSLADFKLQQLQQRHQQTQQQQREKEYYANVGKSLGALGLPQEAAYAPAPVLSQLTKNLGTVSKPGALTQNLMSLGIPAEHAQAFEALPESERKILLPKYFERSGMEQPVSLQEPTIEGPQQEKEPSVASILSRPSPREAAEERRHEEKLASKEKDITRKYFSDISSAISNFEERKSNNEQITKLVKSGKVQTSKFNKLMDITGFGNLFKNPTTELANVYAAKEFSNAVAAFKGKGSLSEREGNTLRAGIANAAMQGERGMLDTAEINTLIADSGIALEEAKRNIIKKNKNVVPLDIDEQAEEASFDRRMKNKEKMLEIADRHMNPQKEVYRGESLPPASQFPGKTITNEKTGQKRKSDGTTWQPVQG